MAEQRTGSVPVPRDLAGVRRRRQRPWPFVIAGITAVATLGVGIAATSAVGLVGAGLLGVWVPRNTPDQSNSVGRVGSR